MSKYAAPILLFCLSIGTREASPQSNTLQSEARVVTCTESQNCSHRFVSDAIVKTLKADGLTIVAMIDDDGHYFEAEVAIFNYTNKPLDVIPSSFTMTLLEPKKKELRYKSPEEVIKATNGRVCWSNFFTALGAASATQQTTSETTTNGNVSISGTSGTGSGTYSQQSTSTTTTPDYQARQDAANQIAANNVAASNAVNNIGFFSLRATTIDPGKSARGTVYFERVRKAKSMMIRIPINGSSYQFTFGW